MPTTAVRLPGPRETGILAVAVVAVSTSAPIIAACAAPALAIAFWRCLLGGGATAPFAVRGLRSDVAALTRRQRRGVILAGVLLAAHFATWIPSLRFTSVASAAALVATQPIWAALIARAGGARVGFGVWVGVTISFTGVVVLTGIDVSLDPRSLVGDGLALLGGVLAAAYVSVAERSRQSLPTGSFTLIVYLTSALALLPLCAALGVQMAGYSARDWTLILALTVIAQLLGHTMINFALERTSATVVSLAILFEVPGAILVAAVWLHQVPPPQVIPALVLLAGGLFVVVRSAESKEPLESPPV
jgi:drug/metabolite transporter (DMT)-like permease